MFQQALQLAASGHLGALSPSGNDMSQRFSAPGSNQPQSNTPSQNLEEKCLARGIRLTKPRRVILAVLQESRDHPRATDVFERARLADPSISAATVYRTLSLLEEVGVIERHDFGEGFSRFEDASRGQHDHLINLDTGQVIEFEDEAFDQMKRAIADRFGVRLEGHSVELYVRDRASAPVK